MKLTDHRTRSKKVAPVTFERSKPEILFQSLVEAFISLCLGSIMSFVIFAHSDASSVLKLVGVAVLIVTALITSGALGEVFDYTKNDRGWRVDIADGVLVWSAPTPRLGATFQVKLVDVKQVRLEIFEKMESEIFPETSYFVDLESGDVLQVGQKSASVCPEDVFTELARQGVVFIRATTRVKNGNQVRTEEIVQH